MARGGTAELRPVDVSAPGDRLRKDSEAWLGAGKRVGAMAIALVVAAMLPACSGFMPGLGGPDAVGPEVRMGPIPVFGAEGAIDEAGTLVWFQTADGWCTRRPGSTGCVGGGDDRLPTGYSGMGFDSGPDQTCVESVTGTDVTSLEITHANGTVTLEPLDTAGPTPVNVFAACWRPAIDPEGLKVSAFNADGDVMGTEVIGR